MNKLIYIVLLLLFTGCSTYTPRDKKWATACFIAQATDYASTRYALGNEDLKEVNPLFSNADDVLLGKIVFSAIIYGAGEIYPKERTFFYKVGTFFGLAATTWNVYQINQY